MWHAQVSQYISDKLRKTLLEAVDSALLLLGDAGKQTILDYLERRRGKISAHFRDT